MIVEFIGCTGAGKSTLINAVQRRLTQTAPVATSYDLVAGPLGLQDVNHPTARNLIQELVGLPFLIPALYHYGDFIAFTLRMLARQANFTIFTINNLRSLARKVGVYEIIRRQVLDCVVLVDEGTILLAHNLFVYSDATYTPEEITRFASLIPLPDLIVYVRAPVDSLVKRSLQRTDPPREMKSKEVKLVEKYIRRAVRMFDCLVETENIRDRLLTVESLNFNDARYEAAVDYLTAAILKNKACQCATHMPPQRLS